MTVSTAYTVLQYAGNGATTAFAVTWPFLTGSLVVTLVASTGVETTQTLGTHYTVSGGTDSNGLPAVGTVTMITAPASGQTLRITRATPKTQASTWGENDAFPQKTIEAALDKLLLITQEGASPGTVNDGIGGDVMELVTSGATDYWDAESHIIRNVADAVEATDAVNYGQIQDVLVTAGAGDVVGPASATDNALARFDTTTGKLLQDSPVTLSDAGVFSWSGGGATIRWVGGATDQMYFESADNGYFFSTSVGPLVNNVGSLGTLTNAWADVFLASGAVINFDAGDVTLTHAANQLLFSGAASGYAFSNAVIPVTSDGAALGTTSNMWSDLFLASGGVINFDNGDVTITHSANTLTFAGASTRYVFNDGNVSVGTPVGIGATRELSVNAASGTGAVSMGVGGTLTGYLSSNGVETALRANTSGVLTLGSNNAEGGRFDTSNYYLLGYTSSNGAYRLQVNSQIFATNATVATSDGRFKTNVAPIEDATEIVKALRPVAYDWKPHEVHQFAKERQAGFIAQEVQDVLKGTDWGASLIQENEQAGEPFLGLAETKLLPVVVKALQEALTRIETLEARLAEVVR